MDRFWRQGSKGTKHNAPTQKLGGIPGWSWPDSERLHRFHLNVIMRGLPDVVFECIWYYLIDICYGITSNRQAFWAGLWFTTRPWMLGYAWCFSRPDPQLFDRSWGMLRHAETWCTSNSAMWNAWLRLGLWLRLVSTVSQKMSQKCLFPSNFWSMNFNEFHWPEVPKCEKYRAINVDPWHTGATQVRTNAITSLI